MAGETSHTLANAEDEWIFHVFRISHVCGGYGFIWSLASKKIRQPSKISPCDRGTVVTIFSNIRFILEATKINQGDEASPCPLLLASVLVHNPWQFKPAVTTSIVSEILRPTKPHQAVFRLSKPQPLSVRIFPR